MRREVERREKLEFELEFAGMKVIGDVEEGGGRPEVLEVRRSAKGCGGWAAGSFPRGNPTADHLECAGNRWKCMCLSSTSQVGTERGRNIGTWTGVLQRGVHRCVGICRRVAEMRVTGGLEYAGNQEEMHLPK